MKKAGSGAVPANILDVVRVSGFSRTTVSNALNGLGRVNPETKAQIEAVAAELDYRPNRNARGLRTSQTGSVALVIPDIKPASNAPFAEFYLHLIGAVAEEAFANGLVLVLSPPLRSVTDAVALGVDGAIVADPTGVADSRVQHLRAAGIPVMTYEQDDVDNAFPAVVSDNDWHVRTLLDHLAENGGTEFLLVVPAGAGAQLGEIEAAFTDWCSVRARVGHLVHSGEGDPAPVAVALAAHPGIDAVLDVSHPAAMGATAMRGMSVPTDIRIAAYVDASELALSHPSVTAIDLRPQEIGAAAVRGLIALRDGNPSSTITVRGELRARESTTRRAE